MKTVRKNKKHKTDKMGKNTGFNNVIIQVLHHPVMKVLLLVNKREEWVN